MTAARFLETRRPAWDRLEELTSKVGRRGPGVLSDEELHELTRLYPSVAVDVAKARMYGMDPGTQRRINQLAIAAHGLLYRRRHAKPLRTVWRFFRSDYPRLFRRLWVCMVLATAIFAASTVGAYVTVRAKPSTAYLFVPRGLDVSGADDVTAEDVSERYRRLPKPPMASAITFNNISVAFSAFALGITAGLGTCYVLLINSMMLGGFFGHFANHGLSYVCYSFLVPHGALEIFAILVSAAAGLRLGLSLAVPGRLTRKASLKAGAREAVMLLLGTIPMFAIAGVLESFVTPSYLPGALKIVIGVLVWGTVLGYLLLAGSEQGKAHVEAVPATTGG
ncbi:MAG: stage II sporulation protein M [Planctomycetota bacterium]